MPEAYDTRALIRLRRGEAGRGGGRLSGGAEAEARPWPAPSSAAAWREAAARPRAPQTPTSTQAAALDPKIAANFAKYGVRP